jgi:hypothetical protein
LNSRTGVRSMEKNNHALCHIGSVHLVYDGGLCRSPDDGHNAS